VRPRHRLIEVQPHTAATSVIVHLSIESEHVSMREQIGRRGVGEG